MHVELGADEEPDGGREPRVRLQHLRRLLLDHEGTGKEVRESLRRRAEGSQLLLSEMRLNGTIFS